ncbi:F-box protein At2g39490-like [Rutidosis leptorrhynchoides]|uniref:F-box protein At2g39490-like n=1 Tax=Rutidosis leptorrhynchoides TaxID=125765 RepID=UPI003A98FE8A
MDHEQHSNNSSKSEIEEDYISKLPDEVLTKILSVYPLDFGSKTVALLTGLWYRPCIKKHGGSTLNILDFQSAVSKLVDNFDEDNPLKMPTRRLEYHVNQKLIVTASIGLNKKLNLDFLKGSHEFSRHNNVGCKIVMNPKDFANPFSVKTLKVTSVNFLTCDQMLSLIEKSRYFETSIINVCDELSSLRIEGQGLAKPMNLSILDCLNLKSVRFEIKSLGYCRVLCWFLVYIVIMYLEDVKKLVFEGVGFDRKLYKWMYTPFLEAIRDVKVLTLNRSMYKKAFQPLLNEEHDFQFNKLKNLWWIDDRMDDDNINSLFSFLKFCTSLERLFITIDPESYSGPCTSDPHNVIKIQNARLHNLKVVKLEGFEDEIEIMYFHERLMDVFIAEPFIVDVRRGMHDRFLVRIPKQQAFGKAPVSNKLKFIYKFVEVEGNISLFSNHPHMP